MKKGIILIYALISLFTLASCSSKNNGTTSGDTMTIITIFNRDYITSDTIVSDLPAGYEYIGDLPKDATNDLGLEGCKMYAVKELNSFRDFYLYQEFENATNRNDASTEQSQWYYVQWVLRK